ncbi:hypothetical protein D3C71_1544920 [compost metagenome]
MLFNQFIDFNDVHATACCNALFTAWVHQVWITTLFDGHRLDNRFHLFHLLFRVRLRQRILNPCIAHARQLIQEAHHAAHFIHLFKLH